MEHIYTLIMIQPKNNEPQEVIDQGLLLESTSNYFNSDGTALEKGLKISIPVWGNYCGPGYSGDDFTKEAQDILDEGCKTMICVISGDYL